MSIGEEIDRLLNESKKSLDEINNINKLKNNQLKNIYESFLKCAKELDQNYSTVSFDGLSFMIGDFHFSIYPTNGGKSLVFFNILTEANNQFHKGPDSYSLSYNNEVFAYDFIKNWEDYLLKYIKTSKDRLGRVSDHKKSEYEMGIL